MAELHGFGDSVSQHVPYLKRIVCRLTRGGQFADDIVQQTVLKALVHADQFRFESSLKTWLTSIATNEIYQVYRSKWRTCVVPLGTETLEIERSRSLQLKDDSYEDKERDTLVRYAVSRLPGPYRCVVELCDLQELPVQQAAQQLGVTASAVKTRLHRARKKLRPLLARLRL